MSGNSPSSSSKRSRFRSPALFFAESPKPMVSIPAARPASIPASASSMAAQLSHAMPSFSAALRKTSGSGLERVMQLPSATASRYLSSPVRSSISGAFLLTEASARR